MNWLQIVSGPVIGGAIGYFTNYLAVKMLFRPHHEIRVFGKTLPFTPGIIPRRRGALARAVANAVSDSLLSRDDLARMLGSDEAQSAVAEAVCAGLDGFLSDKSLREAAAAMIGDERLNGALSAAREAVSRRVREKLAEMNLGTTIASLAGESVLEKTRGTMLAMFVSPDLVASFTGPMAQRIDGYLQTDGMSRIDEMLSAEADGLLNRPAGDVLRFDADALKARVREVYSAFVRDHAAGITARMDVAATVEAKINAMDVAELENLILSVMKHELNAIVNLGAVIGLIIGVLNIFL